MIDPAQIRRRKQEFIDRYVVLYCVNLTLENRSNFRNIGAEHLLDNQPVEEAVTRAKIAWELYLEHVRKD